MINSWLPAALFFLSETLSPVLVLFVFCLTVFFVTEAKWIIMVIPSKDILCWNVEFFCVHDLSSLGEYIFLVLVVMFARIWTNNSSVSLVRQLVCDYEISCNNSRIFIIIINSVVVMILHFSIELVLFVVSVA